jgi:endonuclease III
MDALLALPGVGRKTANLVLIEAFDMDGILTVAVYCENHTEHTDTLCGQNASK